MSSTSSSSSPAEKYTFRILSASISAHRHALETGLISTIDIITAHLHRIAHHDHHSGLNAFTLINPSVFEESSASDARRAQRQADGLPQLPLEGIPYTLKDSYTYAGLTVTNGSPALSGLMSKSDSDIAKRLRAAGAVLLGKTNMPPMAAGGMQRGLYGRAESPYNNEYLTAAFSSGSSNGAATATAASMGVFGMGSETVSSGRSPASNNGLVCYTPSRGVLSCRGLWPLYVTCDVPVPMARSVDDLLEVLTVIGAPEEEVQGDFWREQRLVELPLPIWMEGYGELKRRDALRGKRIGVPKMYVGGQDADPHAKPTTVSPEVVALWERAKKDLEALGAEIVYTDFPLVTNYENDSVSGEANNVVGAPSDWNHIERGLLIAKAWNAFLVQNNDAKISSLADVDPLMLFPKPKDYIPDTFLEVRNWIHYDKLPELAGQHENTSIYDLPGLKQALVSLEAQRKRDLEDWMDELKLDCVAFPANGDVGFADLEFSSESATHSLKNGVKYSNGNRAIRHLGVPTVSVPMGVMEERKMPVNLTFAGQAYEDDKLLSYAYAFEQGSKRRVDPPLKRDLMNNDMIVERFGPKPTIPMDLTASLEAERVGEELKIRVSGTVGGGEGVIIAVYVEGEHYRNERVTTKSWETTFSYKIRVPERLGWDLKPLPPRPVMVLVVAESLSAPCEAKLLWAASG